MAGEFTSSTETRRGNVTYVSEKTGQLKRREIEYAIVDGRAVFEGDIVIGTAAKIAAAEAEGARRLAAGEVPEVEPATLEPGAVFDGVVIVGAQYRWPSGVIHYTIDPSMPSQQRVTNAIAHWEQNTPIRFHARQNEADYVTFVSQGGCWSYVGRQGGQQYVSLGTGCSTGNGIHEIGHTVGLWHEHSRADRDQHVTVHLENVQPGYESNFNQHIADGDDVGETYDYGSIMHYPRDAFTKNGLDTITPPAGVTIGQRSNLTAGDIQAVVYMYGYGGYYIGNAHSKELHLPGCVWVSRMFVGHKRYYWTVEEAKNSGYNGCYYCLRYWDKG